MSYLDLAGVAIVFALGFSGMVVLYYLQSKLLRRVQDQNEDLLKIMIPSLLSKLSDEELGRFKNELERVVKHPPSKS